MHQYHFDIIILGESRASRIAAALLTKSGKRVLTFQDGQATEGPWLFNSLHLDRILDQLGGRDCLTAPSRLQVISEKSRLELHGRHGLTKELRREFPASHARLIDLLRKLETLGQRLENQLWISGGLPLIDFMDQLRFGGKLLFSKSDCFTLRKPLSRLLDEISDPPARACLAALFSGLAMAPLERLTIAEGALLWNGVRQPRGIPTTVLDDLLRRRYKQFHGGYKQLASVEQVDINGRVHLKNARTCSTDALIIGSSEALSYLVNHKATPTSYHWKTSFLKPGVSSLLAPRVILGGRHTLRASFFFAPEGANCIAECRVSEDGVPPSEQDIKNQLRKILPFVSFDIGAPAFPHPSPVKTRPPTVLAFPGTARRMYPKNQPLLCIGAEVLPHLGSVGEIMTGFSLASYLVRKNKPQI